MTALSTILISVIATLIAAVLAGPLIGPFAERLWKKRRIEWYDDPDELDLEGIPNLSVTFNEERVTTFKTSEITIVNAGTVALTPDMYAGPIFIQIEGGAKVLQVRLRGTPAAGQTAIVKASGIEIPPLLFNRGEALRVWVMTNQVFEPNVIMRIADTKVVQASPTFARQELPIPTGLGAAALSVAFVTLFMTFGLDVPFRSGSVVGYGLTALIAVSLIGMVTK